MADSKVAALKLLVWTGKRWLACRVHIKIRVVLILKLQNTVVFLAVLLCVATSVFAQSSLF